MLGHWLDIGLTLIRPPGRGQKHYCRCAAHADRPRLRRQINRDYCYYHFQLTPMSIIGFLNHFFLFQTVRTGHRVSAFHQSSLSPPYAVRLDAVGRYRLTRLHPRWLVYAQNVQSPNGNGVDASRIPLQSVMTVHRSGRISRL